MMENSELLQKIHALLHVAARILAAWLDHILPQLAPNSWWKTLVTERLSASQNRRLQERSITQLEQLDLAALLRVLDSNWYAISQAARLTIEQRNYVKEMFTVRNRWAHLSAQSPFDVDDIYRDIDTLQRFLAVLGTDDTILAEVKSLKYLTRQFNEFPTDSAQIPPVARTSHSPSDTSRDSRAIPTTLQPGMMVCLKHNPARRGALMTISDSGPDPTCLVFLDGSPQTFYLSQIEQFSEAETDTLISLLELHCYLTSLQVLHPSSLVLHSLNAARIDFVPYQFRPALKVIQSDQPRLLIADGVGVGKTIETGLILRELQARYNVQSVLVICPKPLVAERKWERELRRFDERFTHLDGADLRFCINETDMEGEWPDQHKKTILPYSLLDSAVLKGVSTGKKKRIGLEALDPFPRFDLVIVDEAHHVHNPSTYSHKAVRLFCDHADAVLLLSATPLQLANTDLYILLNLLRPDLVIDKASFVSMAQPNVHINNALREARAGDDEWFLRVSESLTAAANTAWGQIAINSNPDYERIQHRLTGPTFSREERIRVIHDIEGLHTFSQLISRTRRRDIGAFCTRRTESVEVPFTSYQKELHDSLLDFERAALSLIHGTSNVKFMITTIRRQAASCIFGLAPFMNDIIERRLQSLEDLEGLDAPPDTSLDFSDSAFAALQATAQRILNQAQALPTEDPKFDALLQVIDAKLPLENNKLMVFSTFRHTLNYLETRLKEHDLRVAVIHGGVEDDERLVLRARFEQPKASPDAIDIMLFSEVGCEGLDYQFCSSLVNYDLPWNPMRIEQRIGRIDRRGQQSEVVSIYNLVTPGTVDGDIYTRCLKRINVFEANIGECEEILGQLHQGIRRIAENLDLSDEERQAKLEKLADNKCSELQYQRELEEREHDLFTLALPSSDADLAVREAESDWLDAHALQHLVQSYFASRCGSPECILGEKPLKTLRLSKESRSSLLEDFRSLDAVKNESSRLWEKWLRGDEPHCVITFDGGCAAEERNALFITPVHPLVLQAANYFGRIENLLKVSVAAVDDSVPPGNYAFAIYTWEFVGVRTELQLIPVCVATEVEDTLFQYLRRGLSSRSGDLLEETSFIQSSLAELEARQRTRWEVRRAEHRARTEQLCSRRMASVESSFKERIRHLERQISETSSEKIGKMRAAQLARVRRSFEEMTSNLAATVSKADIHATCVVFGVLRIRATEGC